MVTINNKLNSPYFTTREEARSYKADLQADSDTNGIVNIVRQKVAWGSKERIR